MTEFEEKIQKDLHAYLLLEKRVGQMLPDAPDIEEKWEAISYSYMPDGMREFANYPTVSLGWMMYIGMALAKMWDENWEHYSSMGNIYEYLRTQRGYDAMDEYIRQDVLGLEGEEYQAMERLVGESASRTYAMLRRAAFEPGTKSAFDAYVSALHQMYLMGAAVQLKAMGYEMRGISL